MKIFSFISILTVALAASAQPKKTNITSDFFILEDASFAKKPYLRQIEIAQSCRDQIRQIMCLVDPPKDPKVEEKNRTCLPGGEVYAPIFENIYEHMPPQIQQMFCSLKKIYVEKKFFGTAYAGMLTDDNKKVQGAILGVRQSILDAHLTLSQWASWKEQLSFGGNAKDYVSTPGLPFIETEIANQDVNQFVYFLISHEFGHMFDFANNVNRFTNCKSFNEDDFDKDCFSEKDSWTSLSWESHKKPKPENDFFKIEGLCFYACEKTFVGQNDVNPLYQGFHQSNFISLYAATGPWDDWADSVAYYMMDLHLKARYSINTGQGATYDIMEKLHSDRMETKHEYLRQFFDRKDLAYPGQTRP